MYSKKRLVVIAAFWIVAGVAVAALSSGAPFLADAQDDRGCTGGPCAFPAENNIGGIILGTEFISGNNFKSFGIRSSTRTTSLPPDRVNNQEPIVGVGVNDVDVDEFFVYKSWYTDRETEFGTTSRDPVNIYIGASTASLSGTSACGNGNENWEGAKNCDLLANTSELATEQLDVSAVSTDFVSPCGVINCDYSSDEYWVVNVEDDNCGIQDALLNGDVCLGLANDGVFPIGFLGISVDEVRVDAYDFIIKTHEVKAVRTDNTDKELDLQNFYFEIRYGKGYDRAKVPDGTGRVSSCFEGPQNLCPFANPIDTAGGKAAHSQNFECQGGDVATNCNIDNEKIGSSSPTATYDDIH